MYISKEEVSKLTKAFKKSAPHLVSQFATLYKYRPDIINAKTGAKVSFYESLISGDRMVVGQRGQMVKAFRFWLLRRRTRRIIEDAFSR